METTGHRPVLYRTSREDRFTVPAEVCEECSDFESGRLVPASFCPEAKRVMDAEEAEEARASLAPLFARGIRADVC